MLSDVFLQDVYHPYITQRTLLPLIYCFLPYKTSVTYRKAFLSLCDYIDPQVVFADFEEAIHSTVQKKNMAIGKHEEM